MGTTKRHVKAVIQLRRAVESDWIRLNPILRRGEPALSTDVMGLKVGDGKKHWLELEYLSDNKVKFIDSFDDVEGQENQFYINTSNNAIYYFDGENFVELEGTSINGLKERVTTNEQDIAVLKEKIIEGADKNYIFKQMTPADTWTIVHNLGKFPSITVVDSAGTVVVGEIILQTTEQAVISFNGAFSGKAYCN